MKKIIVSSAIAAAFLFSTQAVSAEEHSVSSGDTLYGIAAAHNVSVSDIQDWNNLSGTMIYPGDTLQVSDNEEVTYTVQSGDTLGAIASDHGTTADALASKNNISNPNIISIGQEIIIEGGSSSPSTSSETSSGSTTTTTSVDDLLSVGEQHLGATYEFGASPNQTASFDCSSFVQEVYESQGVDLPRTSRDQAQVGTTVPVSDRQEGDLIFFDLSENGVIDHVAIVTGDNELFHATRSLGVDYTNYYGFWQDHVTNVQRVL